MHQLRYLHFLLSILLTVSLTAAGKGSAAVQVQQLRCEMLVSPLGIDVVHPRLSWQLEGGGSGVIQTGYQILVATSPQKLAAGEGDLWNSGQTVSGQSQLVVYNGKPLTSRTSCYWKVKILTNKGGTGWSQPSSWTMGLLEKGDWQARWIGLDRSFPWDSVTKFSRLSARYFRKDFTTPSPVRKATVFIAGLGLYELFINGHRIGDQVLAPAQTDFTKSVKYNTYDVTASMREGQNVIATVLGNGRFFTMRQNYKPNKIKTFGYPKMLLQLEVEYADGSKKIVVSDDTWKVTADGPIRTNNEYDGEEYDARMELAGWSEAGFRDNGWLKPELVTEPGGALSAQMNEYIRIVDRIAPKSIMEQMPGTWILDLGQNMAGWLQLKVRGKAGDQITLKFAETLQQDGSLYVANLRDAKVTDVYTLSGKGEEVWHPAFVYHGFRYVSITGYPGKPSLYDFEGQVVSDDMETSGSFECSNPLLNQIYKNSFWGIRSNYKGMPIDCPQRNERMPWLGDRATGSLGESYIFNNASLYAKWLDDIQQSQTPEGALPDVAPAYWNYYSDNMTWPGTYILVAHMLYTQFGDRQSVIRHYPSMKKWMGYMKDKYLAGNILTKDKYGDWCVPPESPELIHSKDTNRSTDGKLIATAYYFHLLQLMEGFAQLQHLDGEAAEFAVLAEKVKEAFNEAFYHPASMQYNNNSVTSNLLPLHFGMVPPDGRKGVLKNVIGKILVENKGHISTGLIGTQWLMRCLTENGRPDVACTIAAQKDYPGWGYMVAHGATTIWELWNGNTANPQMNSGNHIMLLGDLITWMYEDLAGIKPDKSLPGFERIIMKPSPASGLDFVKATYRSAYGMIRSGWISKGGRFEWQVEIPPNAKAKLFIPARSAGLVTVNGKSVSPGAKFLGMEGDRAVYEVGSGNYLFVAQN